MSKQKEKVEKTEELNEETKASQEEEQQAEPEQKVDETELLNEKIKECEDKYMRLYAEFDNYQKRTQKEKDARYADAVIDTVSLFLEVSDNLDRAVSITVESEESKKVLEGVELVKKQMNDILQKLDVTPIKAVGEEFDPNVHNAVMHVEDDSVTENTIVEEFLKGYIYKNERVVRYSMVKVAN